MTADLVNGAPDRPKFALKLNTYGLPQDSSFESVLQTAREADDAGFDAIYVIDHLDLSVDRYSAYTNEDSRRPYFLDPWTTLGALAIATKEARLGPQVSPIAFRHPSLLAKMGASLDVMSKGRFVLQVGLGGNIDEHVRFGLPVPGSLTQRRDMLVEAIQVIRGLWTFREPFSYNGRHYQLRDANMWPKPVQALGPTIWIGGMGRSTLDVVAQCADGWIPAMQQGSGLAPDQYGALLAEIGVRAEEYGRSPKSIIPGIVFSTSVASTRAGAAQQASVLRRRTDFRLKSLDQLQEQGAVVWGTPKDCERHLERYLESGARHFTLSFLPQGDIESTRRGIDTYATMIGPRLGFALNAPDKV